MNAFSINDVGEIVGLGLTASFDVHAFLAAPSNGASASQSFSRVVDATVMQILGAKQAAGLLACS